MSRCGRNPARILMLLLIGAARACLPAQGQTSKPPLSFAPIGLPSSRSPSPVFNRYAALPPFTARQPARGEWILVPTLEIAQVMIVCTVVDGYGSSHLEAKQDFETLSLELPVAWGWTDAISLEMCLQVQYVWGGFLDGIIMNFHQLLGFPNGDREDFERRQVTVDVETKNGFSLRMDGPALLVSDPVIGAAFRWVRTPRLDLTARAICALPLGLGGGLSGAELPQLGAGIYADWRPLSRISAHALLAGVLPLESFGWTGTRPYPTAQARLSALAELGRGVLLFVDFNLKTSPLSGTVFRGDTDFFRLPNADLLVGLLFPCGQVRGDGRFGAVSIQEDPFSHNASDIRFIGTGAFRW